jgi:hypothetical protein
MASWSMLSGALDPILKRSIESEFHRSIASGAMTSAILAVRNGLPQVFKGAALGAVQSFAMGLLASSVEGDVPHDAVLAQEEFLADRNEFVIQPPITAFRRAFKKEE